MWGKAKEMSEYNDSSDLESSPDQKFPLLHNYKNEGISNKWTISLKAEWDVTQKAGKITPSFMNQKRVWGCTGRNNMPLWEKKE